jgi:hypothetical protein
MGGGSSAAFDGFGILFEVFSSTSLPRIEADIWRGDFEFPSCASSATADRLNPRFAGAGCSSSNSVAGGLSFERFTLRFASEV